MKIVYCSKTGHTERYAKMLAKELKIKCIDIKDYTKDNEKIIFMGWVKGGTLVGYKETKDSDKLCTVAVGLASEAKENSNNIVKANNIEGKFFYLQGGLDYSKVNKVMGFIFKTVGKIAIKKCKEEDIELYTLYVNGGDFIKEENLKNIIKYVKK